MMIAQISARLAGPALAACLLLAAAAHAESSEPHRIVSVGGATTETLFELGQADRVIARDSTSVYPQAVLAKPDVGYMRALSAEGVLALSPDLVLMEEGAGPPDAVSLIAQSGVRIVTVPAGYRSESLPGKIRTIAAAVGQTAQGEVLAEGVARKLADFDRDLGSVTVRKRVLFIMSLADGRPLAAGTGTAADAMIRLAGGENVLSAMSGYKTLSLEAAAALQPDVILLPDHAAPAGLTGDVLDMPAFADTPAARYRALYRMDALYLLGFGPRTPDAGRELAGKLYPSLRQ
ncbi:heme/hemin ABC transporter substrate-binding protein [Terrihabitans rhizophilus]|uniref:ABC transporter substrate-binding protein n=1 Tax=Terrihabitans rhizophilus TaxID=3092662 RepID=A0ABU4RIW7_9HYPH|nr:ABC transporter substrate-binding protein [Terrihabitans sp. PJ23]MDX6804762.1 ABC transporter substrate-binding protein [Terrihabitans sp. PJ23]